MANVPHSQPSINGNSPAPRLPPQRPDYFSLRANHVASHVVVARVVGGTDDLDTVVAARAYERSSVTDDLRLLESTQWADVRRGALIRLAGDVGEHVALGNASIRLRVVGGEIAWPTDWPRTTCTYFVTNGVRRLAGQLFTQRMPEIVRDTFKIVRANQTLIELVARELLDPGYIEADRLRELIDDAVVVPNDVLIGGGCYVD